MKIKAIEVFKNVVFYGVNYIYAIIFNICRLFPVNHARIFVNVYDGRGFEDHPKYIVAKLLARNPDLQIVWFSKKFECKYKQIVFAKPYSLSSLYYMATSCVWISTVRMPLYTKKRKGQIYFQTWHGTLPIKKVEADCEEALSPRYVSYAKKDSTKIDYMISGCGFRTKNFRNSFWYNGEIAELGSARSDALYDPDIRKIIRNKLGIDKDTILLMYAPTFRKKHSVNQFTINFDLIKATVESKFGKNCIIGIRLHPILAKQIDKIKLPNDILLMNIIHDPQEALAATDILITDYSGIVFDFIETKRPAFIYADDLKSYTRDRGLYFSLSELPFASAENNEILNRNIQNFDKQTYIERVNLFCEKVGLVNKGNSSEIIADFILDKIKCEQ